MAMLIRPIRIARNALAVTGLCVLACSSATGQPRASAELLASLRAGGQLIVMRHASSPLALPDKATAQPDNTGLERQLDEAGRATAIAMGRALRALKIPVGTVLSSPTYRALETVRLAQLPTPVTRTELGDGGQNMQGVSATQGQWLQEQAKLLPKGSNKILVTHLPNISAAFPEYSTGLADGEALVFGPDGKGGVALLARIKIEDWPTLGN